jgi:hypothetical protein
MAAETLSRRKRPRHLAVKSNAVKKGAINAEPAQLMPSLGPPGTGGGPSSTSVAFKESGGTDEMYSLHIACTGAEAPQHSALSLANVT